jgi:rhamnose utilization protein RhaD (predicted bifunctional aldolase and dehydrogenase)
MIKAAMSIQEQVKAFCAQIGADPLLVQGAGGNVSWKGKDDNILWIKASGTWLAEAESNEIFVSVNLVHLQDALAKQDFFVKPEVNSKTGMRPSIETLLHALMPQRVVVHLHPVEILAHLVQINAKQKIQSLIGDVSKWIYVDYFRPGADLAKAVSEKLRLRPDADVVFMGNHGLVVGGNSVEDVMTTLHSLTSKLKSAVTISGPANSPLKRQSDFFLKGYVPCSDEEIGHLALKEELINRLRDGWALYPDHVVFLGARAAILEKFFKLSELDELTLTPPPFIFAVGDGVYKNLAVTSAQENQLRCYFDVLSRLNDEQAIVILSHQQIYDLLDWDAEKFRKKMA